MPRTIRTLGRKSAPRAHSERKQRSAGIARRKAILAAALRVFAEQGFDGASTRAIAAAAGVEQGHLAYYFKSKESLWRAVVRSNSSKVEEDIALGLEDVDLRKPVDVARDLLGRLLTNFADNPYMTRLMLQEFSVASPRHDWVVGEVGLPIWKRLEPLFIALHKQGAIRGTEPAFSYLAILGGALLFFGSQPEVRVIANIDSGNAVVARAFTEFLVKSIIPVTNKQT